MEKGIKTVAAPPSFKTGDVVLYTPETVGGNANGMREYLAFIGQVEIEDGVTKYHLMVCPPFGRPQWYGNVQPFKKGEPRRGSFRARDEAEPVPV